MRKISIVAVHGTFAPDAPWAKDGSSFATALRSELADAVVSWHSFGWSGANTHAAREEAAEGLARYLLDLNQHENPSTYLICHSHGGNVALMAILQSPELRNIVAGVVCLSTPFFQVKPSDFEGFIETSKDSLNLRAIAVSSFAYFAAIDFLSNKFPELQEPAMWTYAILLLSAMVTSAATHWRLRKGDQLAVLERYNYLAVRQPCLVLWANYDEAFHWIGLSTLASNSILIVFWIVTVAALIAYYLTFGLGIFFAIPLILLSPLLFIAGTGLRALVRVAPFTVGEHPITGMLANFSSSNQLATSSAENVGVPISFTDTHGRLRLRHSALYESPVAQKHIARFISLKKLIRNRTDNEA